MSYNSGEYEAGEIMAKGLPVDVTLYYEIDRASGDTFSISVEGGMVDGVDLNGPKLMAAIGATAWHEVRERADNYVREQIAEEA